MSWNLKVDLSTTDAEIVSNWLWMAEPLGITQVSDDLESTLIVGFKNEAETRSAAQSISQRGIELIALVEEWANDWQGPPPKVLTVGDEAVAIDAGHAFGHGEHTTTALLLDWLVDLALEKRSVLDFGTGSGVLAIAAAKLGASPVLAVDNDPASIESALTNVAANSVNVAVSDITAPDLDGTFDLVLANMLPANLAPVAPDLARLCGDRILVCGLLDSQIDEVAALLTPLELTDSRLRDGWAALELRRP